MKISKGSFCILNCDLTLPSLYGFVNFVRIQCVPIMAKKSNNDLSGEILEFRQSLSKVLSRRLSKLEHEIGRIKRLSLMFPKEETHGLRVVGNIDLTQFDPTKGRKRERIKRSAPNSGIANVVSGHSPEKKELEDSYKRFLLDCFIEEAEAIVDNARNYYIQSSSLQFTVMRKEISEEEISDWNLVIGDSENP